MAGPKFRHLTEASFVASNASRWIGGYRSFHFARNEDIKKAFSVFATLIGLAQAIVSGSPQGILDSLDALREADA